MKRMLSMTVIGLLIFMSASVYAADIFYAVHVQDLGDSEWVSNGEMAGTTGQGKRIEALWIYTRGLPRYGKVCFKTHLAEDGWTKPVCEDEVKYDDNGKIIIRQGSGSRGQARRVEAVEIWLENAPGWGVEYQVHAAEIGWMAWRRDGDMAGTTGEARRIEAVKIELYKK